MGGGVLVMLAAESLLKALERIEDRTNPKGYKQDYDFDEVLAFCSSGSVSKREIRCSDEKEREFLFDKK